MLRNACCAIMMYAAQRIADVAGKCENVSLELGVSSGVFDGKCVIRPWNGTSGSWDWFQSDLCPNFTLGDPQFKGRLLTFKDTLEDHQALHGSFIGPWINSNDTWIGERL